MPNELNLQNLSFEELYEKVKPIVFRLRRFYHIQLWDSSDWEQEAMICLYRLIQDKPCCLKAKSLYFACFKTKFSNYLKDVLRSQESHKRRLNRMPYEEISDLSFCIGEKGLWLDDLVSFRDNLNQFRRTLSNHDREKLDSLIRGEQFRGRKNMLRQLEVVFKEFKIH